MNIDLNKLNNLPSNIKDKILTVLDAKLDAEIEIYNKKVNSDKINQKVNNLKAGLSLGLYELKNLGINKLDFKVNGYQVKIRPVKSTDNKTSNKTTSNNKSNKRVFLWEKKEYDQPSIAEVLGIDRSQGSLIRISKAIARKRNEKVELKDLNQCREYLYSLDILQ